MNTKFFKYFINDFIIYRDRKLKKNQPKVFKPKPEQKLELLNLISQRITLELFNLPNDDNSIFVSHTKGKDKNKGSRYHPKKTLRAALKACTLNRSSIIILDG